MERDPRINITPLALVAVHKRLLSIEELLKSKVPVLPVDDAVPLFWERHLNRTKNPRPYHYLMDKFLEAFSGRNTADITPEEIESFLLGIAENPNTRAYRANQLKGFFSFCNRHLMRQKAPTFQNPLDILSYAKENKDAAFIRTETVRAMVQAAESDRERLVVLILATTGLRAGELAELSPEDVQGGVLVIKDPKSLRYNAQNKNYTEVAVMPSYVSELVHQYLKGPRETDTLVGSYRFVYRTVKRLSKKAGADLSPHDLRRFCATYWERLGEYGMVAFTLRHRSSNHLGDPSAECYVARLTVSEAMGKQDLLMENFMEKQEAQGTEE
jgi:integrase